MEGANAPMSRRVAPRGGPRPMGGYVAVALVAGGWGGSGWTGLGRLAAAGAWAGWSCLGPACKGPPPRGAWLQESGGGGGGPIVTSGGAGRGRGPGRGARGAAPPARPPAVAGRPGLGGGRAGSSHAGGSAARLRLGRRALRRVCACRSVRAGQGGFPGAAGLGRDPICVRHPVP